MSKTTEYLIPPTMQLTPKHVDAMHLIKLFVKEYEDMKPWNTPLMMHDNFYETCKLFGF